MEGTPAAARASAVLKRRAGFCVPRAVLARCEWGHDDYSLRVENLPKAPPPKGQMGLLDEDGK
jgi:hypothetical protein